MFPAIWCMASSVMANCDLNMPLRCYAWQEYKDSGVYSKLLLRSKVDDHELAGFNELDLRRLFWKNQPKTLLWTLQIGLMQLQMNMAVCAFAVIFPENEIVYTRVRRLLARCVVILPSVRSILSFRWQCG